MNLFRKKSIQDLLQEAGQKDIVLKKDLGAFDLSMLGIGAIIGTGIFVLTGVAAQSMQDQHLFYPSFYQDLHVHSLPFVMRNLLLLFQYQVVRIRIVTRPLGS